MKQVPAQPQESFVFNVYLFMFMIEAPNVEIIFTWEIKNTVKHCLSNQKVAKSHPLNASHILVSLSIVS